MAIHVEVVGAAVQHVDPLRRRGGRADLIDDVAPDVGLPVALEPLAGVLPLGGGLAVVDPLAGQADDPLVLGPDDQGGMEVEAIAAAVAGGGQVGDLAMDAEVQLGRVAQDQEAAGPAGPRPLPVRGGDRLEGDAVGVQEAVGGLGLGPALHLAGDAGGGVGGHPGGDEDQPLGAPSIAQVGRAELLAGPAAGVDLEGVHGLVTSPIRWRSSRPCLTARPRVPCRSDHRDGERSHWNPAARS